MGHRPVLTGLLLFSVFLFVAPAQADRRIVPGASISLAPEKSARMPEILTRCLQEETIASLTPKLSSVGPAPGTSAEISVNHRSEDERTGDNLKWTTKVTWLPAMNLSMKFLEWSTPSTSVERELSLDVSSSTYDPTFEETDLDVDLFTDAEGQQADVGLKLTGALPYYQSDISGAQHCSINNWGREECVEIEKSTAVSLVIPKAFVNSGTWINRQTSHPTLKTFNYFKYAECLLWHWEN